MCEGVYVNGLTRLIPMVRKTNTKFVNNGRFTITGGRQYFDFDNCIIKFENIRETEGTFDIHSFFTLYGWNIAHSGQVLANDSENLSLALHRHLSVREPDIVLFDAVLRNNQRTYIVDHWDELHQVYINNIGYTEWMRDMLWEAYSLRFMPHEKRELREKDILDRLKSGGMGDDVWCHDVEFKLKLMEYSKSGKKGRIIVDLGVGASLQGAPWSDFAKHELGDRDIIYKGCKYRFVTKCDPVELRLMYAELFQCTYKFCIYVFSDDAMAAIRVNGELYWIELDFSSCDCSHENELFDLLFSCMRCPKDVKNALTKQILSNIKINNPRDKRQKIWMKPRVKYLQSGITITTLINCFAWYICFVHIANNYDNIKSCDDIISLCEDCGYIVTYNICKVFEEAIFLKTIPVICECCKVYQPVPHPGVMCRASGTKKRKLNKVSKNSTIEEDAIYQQTSIMNGLQASISYPPWEVLNPKTHDTIEIGESNYLRQTQMHLSEKHIFSKEKLYARFISRFSWDVSNIQKFEDDLKSCAGFGKVVYSKECNEVVGDAYSLPIDLTFE